MKNKFNILLFSIFILIVNITFAQAPEGINYQAVLRNTVTGTVIPNGSVNVQIKIISGTATGAVIYQEIHPGLLTNQGLVNLVIGKGLPQTGTFASIPWSTGGNFFVNTAIQIGGVGNFVDYGTQQLMSVPYALYAKYAGNQLNQWRYGNTAPASGLGNLGDFFLDLVTGNVHYKNSTTTWQLTGNIKGPQGVQGLTGPSGASGPVGATGAQGPIGLTGPAGATGATGAQGPIGLTGPAGATGATGPQGIIGLTGPIGATGVTGAQGPIGLTGPAGATGAQGPIGLTGPAGATGATGAQGTIGLTGPAGATGAIGAQGPIGLTGPAGATGATGAQGPIGLIGPTGATGATGAQGPIGLTGPQGPTGAQGPIGLIGLTGSAGATGPQGLQGLAGTNGTNGTNGLNALIKTTTEPTGANCANGGTKIETGLDANGNGLLDVSEINTSQTKYVCNGVNGSSGSGSLSNGTSQGEMLYWNGSTWIVVPPGQTGQTLTFCYNAPQWGPCLAQISTLALSNVTGYQADCGGTILNNGANTISSSGVCWSTSPNPTINDNINSNGNSSGTFNLTITGLTPNTTYYVRAYAINSSGVSYGNQVDFITSNISLPSVTTGTLTFLTGTSATINGNVTNNGGASITSRGFCWSTNSNPTILNSNLQVGNGLGFFNDSITGLTPSTTYYVRAYAINSSGIAYGNEISFTPNHAGALITTSTASNITYNSAIIGGNVLFLNQNLLWSHRGVLWSTNPNPTIINSDILYIGTGLGEFNDTLIGLNGSTTYYLRAFISNGYFALGPVISFTTSQAPSIANLPLVTSVSINNILYYSAIAYGNVISDGGATVTSRGFCYSTSPNPTINNNTINVGNGTGSFNDTITGLNPYTAYYVRAFATNSSGTSYGSELNFTPNQVPTLNCDFCGAAGGQELTCSLMQNGIIYATINQPISMTSYKCSNTQYMDCSSSGFNNPSQASVISYNCIQGTGNSISQVIYFSTPGIYSVSGFAGSSSQQKSCTVYIVIN
jgi:hypothetical protein